MSVNGTAVLIGDFNSHHPDWGYQDADQDREFLQDWASSNDLLLLHDSKQRGTFHSARWQRDYSPDFAGYQRQKAAHSLPLSQSWTTSHIVSTVLQLSTLASSYLSSEELNVKGGISGRPTRLLSLLLLNVPFR